MKIVSEQAELNTVKVEQVQEQKKYKALPNFIHGGHKLFEFNGTTGAVKAIPIIEVRDRKQNQKLHEVKDGCLYALGMNEVNAKKRLKKVNKW